MKYFTPIIVSCASLFLIGCDSGNQPPPPAGLVAKAEPQSSFPELKKSLEAIASSGDKGAGFTSLQQQIDQSVRGSNATLADELMKDYQALSSASGAEIKTIAARMAGKL